jgi:hypothetical protein
LENLKSLIEALLVSFKYISLLFCYIYNLFIMLNPYVFTSGHIIMQSILNYSTNKMSYVQDRERTTVSPQFIFDVLGYIRHMVVELLDFLWHYLCWPMIRAMTYFMTGP